MERDQWPTALVWTTLCLGATTAAVFATSKWWRRRGASDGSKAGARKPLAKSSRGIRIVRVQDAAQGSNGLGVWGTLGGIRSRNAKDDASKWEKSKQKGDLGYYFAHHTSLKELAPEDYQMNGPRLLSKGDQGVGSTTTSESTSPPAPAVRRRAHQITSYSWEDFGEEVRLTFRQPGWDWSKVDAEDIGVEWGPRRLRLSMDTREYGLHTIDLSRLNGEVDDVRALKMKSRLVVALRKGGRGTYAKKSPWDKLQTAPQKSSDGDVLT